ncbi:MAG: tyrosine-type recombinase/integrase [Myxococcales bacterium]|nr:tyrosine-type recombinase/integrase [Myxococcales bacterium]
MAQALDVWWSTAVDGSQLAPATQVGHRSRVRAVAETIGHVSLQHLSARHIEVHRLARHRAGLTAGTIQTEVGVLVVAWRWLHDIGLLDREPPSRVTGGGRRPARPDKYTPSRAEALAVIGEAPRRIRLGLLLQLATGARQGEILALQHADVAVEGRRAVLQLGRHEGARKTGTRAVPLAGDIVDELRDFWRPGEAGPLLGLKRVSLKTETFYWLRDFPWDERGLTRWTTHALRRLAADTLLRSGVEIGTAAAVLGHSPQVMLQMYRQVTAEDAQRAVAQAGLGDLTTEAARVVPIRGSGTESRHKHR